jgi:hypothetical protein
MIEFDTSFGGGIPPRIPEELGSFPPRLPLGGWGSTRYGLTEVPACARDEVCRKAGMLEIRTSGLMSEQRKRGCSERDATAPFLDSTR